MRAALLASCSPARRTLSIASWMTDVLTGVVLDTPPVDSWSPSSVDAKGLTRCVILDDTDLPKRGYKAEGLGKVFSHTAMRRILGFKALFLCYTDGKTQLMVDATIQAETGKDTNKPQGLTRKQKAAQYSKERGEDEKVNTRKAEMLQSKIANAIKMLRKAILEGVRFDYLLVDSWFPCAELLQFSSTVVTSSAISSG